jgi:hypothetical protein
METISHRKRRSGVLLHFNRIAEVFENSDVRRWNMYSKKYVKEKNQRQLIDEALFSGIWRKREEEEEEDRIQPSKTLLKSQLWMQMDRTNRRRIYKRIVNIKWKKPLYGLSKYQYTLWVKGKQKIVSTNSRRFESYSRC